MKIIHALSAPLLALAVGCTENVDIGHLTQSTGETAGDTGATADEPGVTTGVSETTGGSGQVTTTAADTTSGASTGDEAGASDTTSGDTTSGDTTGEPLDCAGLVEALWPVEPFLSSYDGSLDLAFDGQGNLALMNGVDLSIVAADTSVYVFVEDFEGVPTSYLADGRLLGLIAGDLWAIDPRGYQKKYLLMSGLVGANQARPDLSGNVWVTQMGDGGRIFRIDSELNVGTIWEGNGDQAAALYDDARGQLYYQVVIPNMPNVIRLMRVPIGPDGTPGEPSVLLESNDGTNLVPVDLDACGNLYLMVDYNASSLQRMMLDEAGTTGELQTLVLALPLQTVNLRFGAGPGFDVQSLYAIDLGGGVHRIAGDVPGAPRVVVE